MKRVLVSLAILLVVAVLCGALIWFNFFRDSMVAQFVANVPVPTVTVSTVEVKPQRWTPGIDAVGTVSAAEGVDVAGEVGGVVTAINFKANDRITKGDVLVQLDDTVERATLVSAQSTVAVARNAFDRTRQLFDRNVATSADLQAAQNRLDLAIGELNRLEASLAQRAIKSPFSGTIGIPRVEVGQYVQPGMGIATLQNLDRMRVDFTVPEQRLPQLELGQAVNIGLAENELDFKGTITGIDPKIDPNSRLVSVQALVDNINVILRPGQFVRVRVHLPEENNVVALPQTAVVISLYGSYVYQVVEAPAPPTPPPSAPAPADGAPAAPTGPALAVKQIFVETGRRSDTQIEVLKGVEPGMQIVSSGQNKLSNGSRIAIDNSVNPADTKAAAATP